MATTAETIQNYYNTILARTGSAAEVAYWVNQVDNVGISLSQVQVDFATSTEALTNVAPIVEMYEADLGRAPDAAGLAYWVGLEKSGTSLATIAADIADSTESQTDHGFTAGAAPTATFVTNLYESILGRQPASSEVAYWMTSGLSDAQIVAGFGASTEAQADYKSAVTTYLGTGGGADINTVTLTPGQDNIALTGNNNVVNGTYNGSALTTPSTFTAGDTIKGAAGSTGNVLNLADIGGSGIGPSNLNPTNLAGVTVSGIQTLNINSTEAVIANTATSIEGFTGLTALNIQDAGGTSATAAGTTAVTVNDSAAGAASETVLGGSNDTVTAAGVTTGGVTIGSATAAPTGAIAVTTTDVAPGAANQIAGQIMTTGGTTVSVTENIAAATSNVGHAYTATGGAVIVNGTTLTTAVNVAQTAPITAVPGVTAVPAVPGATAVDTVQWSAFASPTTALTDLETIGGVTVQPTIIGSYTAQQVAEAAAGQPVAGLSVVNTGGWVVTNPTAGGATTFTYNTPNTAANVGAGNVNGTSPAGIPTATVVNAGSAGSPAVPAVAAVGGIGDGAVTINDVNAGSTTKAGTITNVSLSNYGNSVASATINDNALANLTLAGTGNGVTINDTLSTPTATTLGLTLNGLTDNTGITDANHEITTLNVTTGGTSASTLHQFVDSGLTTLNVSGTQAFNLGISPSTLTAINVSGGASLSNGPGAGYALGVNTAFTSTSTGTDVVEISGPTTKTVTGNGSVNEEIVWNGNAAPAAATGYLGNVKGFSVLGLGSAVTSETFDLSKLTGFTGFDVEENTNGSAITLANVTAGSPLAIDNTFNGTLVYQTADSSGATDSLGVTLGAAANPAGFNVNTLTAEDSKSVGIGTLTLTSNTSGTSGLAFDSITTLTDSSLSTLNVAGTGGLLIGSGLTTGATSLTINGTSTGALPITILGVNDTALTTLNLSGTDAIALGTITDGTAGITVNGSADNANVSFALTGATASGKTDSITLGNGTENISDLNAVTGATVNITVGNGGTSTNANNISVGAANSTIMAGSGVNTISAGNGNNTITVGGGGGSIDVGNGNNTISAGNGAEAIIVGSGNNTITAGSGGDTISVGAGLNAITVGAGADTLNFTTGNNGSGSIYSTITGAQAGDTLNFTAGGGLGTTLAQVTGASTTSFATLLSDAAAASTGAAGDMGWFQYSGNTYVVDNVKANAAFGTGDYVVGLAGLHNLTTGATVSGSGTTDTLTLGSHFA